MTQFDIPEDIQAYLKTLDGFIDEKIRPIEERDDNGRFFDHRREHARTDWDNDGLPREEWEALLNQVIEIADDAGHYRYALPEIYGGQNGSHLGMACIREHLAARGLGLHNDLQNEHSIVGNLIFPLMFRDFGSDAQHEEFVPKLLAREYSLSFGLTEAAHGSDATHMETTARKESRDGVSGWVLDGEKMWSTGLHTASHILIFARHAGDDGSARGIGCFIVPTNAPGFEIGEYMWTFNMPTDHPTCYLKDVFVPDEAVLGDPDFGLAAAQHFLHENRIRQAASSLGAARYCIDEAVKYAAERKPFGKPLSANQGIQFPLVELHAEHEMLQALIHKTAAQMDEMPKPDVAKFLSDKISICNYRANRLACDAADRSMQVHGGLGYSRHKPFEHIYRHHRRYRITEGAEEIQMRKIGGVLFGYVSSGNKNK